MSGLTPLGTGNRNDEDYAGWVDDILSLRCQVAKLWPYQLELSKAIDGGSDVFVVIATGMGKTVVLQAGAILADARGEKGVAFLIVPTKVLVEQQADVASRRGLRALAINHDTLRKAAIQVPRRDLFKELCSGDDVRMAVMTPKMLFGPEMTALLKTPEFVNLVRWMSIDEAQLVQQEGIFQAGYKSLPTLRMRLNSSTIWCAATATATAAEALEMGQRLGFHRGYYINARYSLDRPNLKYIPRFFEHPSSGTEFLDFSFVVPLGLLFAVQIIATIIFADTIKRGDDPMSYLDSLIPGHIPRRLELIKTYNSLMPYDYRQQLKTDFQSGHVRVIIVTDTATYGFDTPNIRRAILADIPKDYKEAVQKFGRAGRDGLPAEVIAFAPAWVREPPPGTEITSKQGQTDAERRGKLPEVMLRWYNPTPACCPRCADTEHNGEAFVLRPDCCVPIHDADGSTETLALVAQWVEYFDAKKAADSPPRLRSDGTFHALDKQMKESLTLMLDRWRHRRWAAIRPSRDHATEFFFPRYILMAIVEKAHVCTSLENLKIISDGWKYFPDHGEDFLLYLTTALEGFEAIFQEGKVENAGPSEESESDTDDTSLSGAVKLLRNYATAAILKSLCRTLSLGVGGNKDALVDRLSGYYIAHNHPFPTRADIDNAKATQMRVDEPPLSNRTNIMTPRSPKKLKQKRKRAVSGSQNRN
ncbi:P-loop containing nucleoside triphosphate hydrolase protein [Mycena rebaudengoi]|nr:P-loop containing nucleoside triphosphate hydrolase protein [Mycena rebaudengoi]